MMRNVELQITFSTLNDNNARTQMCTIRFKKIMRMLVRFLTICLQSP